MSGEARSQKQNLLGKRPVAIVIAIGLLIGVLVSVAAGGDDEDGYLVRAVFDNGSFVIPGEDVKIAGVKVGAIEDVDLTEDNKAALVLRIEDPAFIPFRSDAQCQIRLQSLIGEQFIDCVPTRPRKEGLDPKPELKEIADGRGAGQHLLPVDNNVTPVGEDLLRDINRLPQREGLRLLINELGAGLAGNGERLREAVRRANPALKELDGFVKVLAEQDRLLGRLTDESDTVLAAWAQKRKETANFIDEAGALGAATAERGDDLERNFERLPGFLREFKPTAASLSGLSDQMGPALASLDSQSKAINTATANTKPFFAAATPALTSLGDFGDRARELFPALRPLIGDLDRLGQPLRPATANLAKLFGSVDDTGGIEELMKLIYFYTGTTNGVDSKGHYVRSSLNITNCASRQPTATNCASTLGAFGDPIKAAATMAGVPTNAEEFKKGTPGGILAGIDLNAKETEPLLDYLFGEGGGR